MSIRLPILLGFAVGLGGVLAAPSRAQDSPFIPAGAAAAPVAADGSSFELRGMMTTPQGPRFCVFDPATKTGVWVGLKERGHSFVVNDWGDAGHSSVLIETSDGRRLTVGMRQGKVVPLSGGNPQMGAQPPNPTVGNVVLNPTPETEQARLQAITDEVRRRRLLREQAQNPQGGQPAQR